MSRTTLNFWLDLTMLVTFLAGLWVELVIRLVFPPGTTAGGWQLWGLTYDHWFELQFGLWCALTLCVLVHVMLHWTWVCGVVASQFARDRAGKKRHLADGERTLFGVGLLGLLFAILGIGLAAAMFTVVMPGG